MKLTYLTVLLLGLFLIDCKHEAHEQKAGTSTQGTMSSANASDTTGLASEVYVCPMHPEIKGKAGDVCSKCNMALVSESSLKKDDHSGHGHEGHNH